nr:S8 family serine peptidase [Kibdelosporangium sp. MJ126-NF4]CEL14559.1 probable secreted peptidase [Kibdelosporangium sp. MJ126-NF4]CTQ88924.1 probable secreted peptidase [Kibdelosporangium sp. MJ126-NF4]
MHWRSRVLTIGCAGALVLGAGQVAGAAPAPETQAVAGRTARHAVTLVTGDTVHIEQAADGKQAATIQPGPGREQIGFYQNEVDGNLFVFPQDALSPSGSRQLDRSLFNVTELIRQGYTDEQTPQLPLIVRYGPQRATLAAAEPGVTLASVHSQAVRADKRRAGEFWKSAEGVERISLDRKVRASLDHSVPQIGAPEAWAAGYDGTGTTVAVLDTGADAGHQDLRGKIAGSVNFTTAADTTDHFGHGTHVAATVAGNGVRKGVAPGAKLLIGKVLDDEGNGYESWILAGMEWAANSGAKIVNLSLGGDPTDGTDPMSQGLNEISERTGALFVVAAGNSGETGPYSVGTPGSADAALTVGAVDRADKLAYFSSRGPRVNDLAVKPDITGPGVDIVAARAAGTTMGTPVDDKYTAASGTSMATPHVAGAAAILAQRNPGWTGKQLKDALASTSKPGDMTAFEQGGGRVDVPRALKQSVYATGTLNIGAVTTGVVRKEVTYTNATNAPVTLNLALDLKSFSGNPAGDAVRPDKSTVEIQPGGTATVGIVVDGGKLKNGAYGGRLTATAGGVLVHTAVGLNKEAPRYKVTVLPLGTNGKPTHPNTMALWGEDSRFDTVITWIPKEGGKWETEVAEGMYYLGAEMSESQKTALMVIKPTLQITKDTTVVLDAREATTEVVVQTPQPSRQKGIFSFYSHREFGTRNLTNYAMKFDGTRKLFVSPTEKVRTGSFEFGSRWSLVAPELAATPLAPNTKLEPDYAGGSPKINGYRLWQTVTVGAGQPGDYRGKDVRGKIALVAPKPEQYDEEVLAQNAAKAGAAMVLVTSPEGWLSRARAGELPIPTATVTHAEGTRLAESNKLFPVFIFLHGVPESPYLYDVMHVEQGQVPNRIAYRASERNSALVRTAYHESGGDDRLKEQRFGWRPWQKTAINQYQRTVRTPWARDEWVTAGDTTWQHRVKHHISWESMNPLSGGMIDAPRRYRAGEQVDDEWYSPVTRPAIPKGVPGLESTRDGDMLKIRIPEFSDGANTHYAFTNDDMMGEPDKQSARLFKDGKLLTSAPDAWRDFPVTADPANYRLEMTVERRDADWQFATRTDTAWTFKSQQGKGLLPLLQVDYSVPADLANKLPADRRVTIGLHARHQTGPTAAKFKAWVSYDDGKTWREVEVDRQGRAVVDHPRLDQTNGFVALRVQGADAAGNSVEQTVLRAYGLNLR